MLSSRNGHSSRQDSSWPLNSGSEPVDDRPIIIIGPNGKVFSSADSAVINSSSEKHSGKLLVIVLALTILAIFATLTMAFQQWRTRYQRKANYGTTSVVPVIDQLLDVHPPNVTTNAWRGAIDRTRTMLKAVTTSNLLSLEEMQLLREELISVVIRSTANPESAVTELSLIWNSMSDRAEFLLRDRAHPHLRPEILPPPPAKVRRFRTTLPKPE